MMQDIDKEIHDMILDNENYMDVLNNDDRWEVLYNLSSLRENLLEWYSFDENASLLEIGGEFGALTSLFCKRVSRVVSLCDNDLQKESIEYRCKNYSNIQVIKSIQEINGKFDYITIINPQKEVQELIDSVAKFLNEKGKIIIACDNSLALKCFLDNDERKKLVCVSKRGITDYLKQSFNNISFYYPSPDFRLPNVIYSEKYLPREGDIRNVNVRFDSEKYQIMNEDYIYDAVCDENIYENMANSYLIIASK